MSEKETNPARQDRPAAVSLRQTMIEAQFSEGPLPPAQELAAYEHITPGLADRIVTMAEKEQGTRHVIMRRRNLAQIWITAAGQFFGFILALAIIAIAGWLLAHDKPIAGFAALLTGIATLVGPFIYRKKRPQQQPPAS